MKTIQMALRAGTAGALAALTMMAGCGSMAGSDMSRRADVDIEMARHRQRDEKAEITNPATYLSLIRKMQEQGLYYASLAHIDAYEQRYGHAPAVLLESSGGLTLANAAAYASTGVDYLAVGALTHSVRVLDVGLDM